MKKKLLQTIIWVIAIIFASQTVRADTATQLAATINGFTGGGTGKLTATVAGNTVTVTGSLTGVTSGTIPGINLNIFKNLPPAAMKGMTPDMLKSVSSGLTLNIDASVTVVWKALISAGSDFTTMGSLVTLSGSGTFEVAGGKIEANDNNKAAHAIVVQYKETTLTIKISSGTVSAAKCDAISHEGKKSRIIVSGTGHVQCTGEGWSAISTNGNVEVRDDAEVSGSSNAIFTGGSLITISGGTVTTTGELGVTIKSTGNGAKVTISGGLVFAGNSNGNTIGGKNVIMTEYNPDGFTGATGTGVIVAWNRAAGHESYKQGSSDDIIKSPASATAVWDIRGTSSGISYANGSNTGFIPLNVTVK